MASLHSFLEEKLLNTFRLYFIFDCKNRKFLFVDAVSNFVLRFYFSYCTLRLPNKITSISLASNKQTIVEDGDL